MEQADRFKSILPVITLVTFFATFLVETPFAMAGPRTTLQSVACPVKGVLKVDLYNENAQLTGIKLNAFEPVNAFQGFGLTEVFRGEGASKRRFVRVQVPGQSNLAGKNIFIFENAIQILNTCESLRKGSSSPEPVAVGSSSKPESILPAKFFELPKPVSAKPIAAGKPDKGNDEGDDEHEDAPQAPEHKAVPQAATGAALASAACCIFPLKAKPKSYLSGMGRFGAGRSSKKGTRSHAGADLYGTSGQAVFAIAPGTVIRAPYYFKSGTLAVDVRHKGGYVARYGEISNKSFGLKLDSAIAEGQKLGEMKYVPGAPSSMLHFELYQGNMSGKLSMAGTKYYRRGDLLNPTQYLNRWKVK